MRYGFIAAFVALLLAPGSGGAQEAAPNRFTLEPYAGALSDTYGNGTVGALAGLKLGYALSDRGRLVGSAGFAEVNDAGNAGLEADYFTYGNNYAAVTAGVEYDVIPGRTSASLNVQAGALWREIETEGQVGAPLTFHDPESAGFESPSAVWVPGVTVRRQLTPRAALALNLQDYIFEGFQSHSPAVSLGFSFR